MAERTVGITLLGCGVVGGGVVALLNEQRELLRRRTGLTFEVRHVVVRDPGKYAGVPGLPLTTDAAAAIDDPRVDVVVELVGGTTAAAAYVERALAAGKPVVTANKSLLAARGQALFALARSRNTCIAFEASCGGGVPIINAITTGLVGNRIDALVGIVNGTCNFILTRMTREGSTYADALRGAQEAGFAEADPTLDVSGRDAAQKLALLAGLAFDARVSEADIHIEGIESIQPADIELARELGYVIKLLAIAERTGGPGFGTAAAEPEPGVPGLASPVSSGAGATPSSPAPRAERATPTADSRICLRVHPTLVHQTDVLADVGGSFNAISVYGHALGHALFYGRGAGRMPTASAVVADVVSVALGTAPLAFAQLRIFSDTTPAARVLPIEDLRSRYYLRLAAKDVPGVLATVTDALGRAGISLSAVHQRETDAEQYVPVVITTHKAIEGAMRRALEQIDALPTIRPPTVCLRIIDQPKEFAGG